jgi:hypothetical protein
LAALWAGQHVPVPSQQRDGAVAIRAQGPDPVSVQPMHRQRRRMAVGIARAERGDGYPGVHGSEKGRVLVRRSVVRDLQHLSSQGRFRVEQVLLGDGLDVAGQQRGEAGEAHAQHDRGIVRIRLGAVVGLLGCQHGPAQAPHGTLLTVADATDRHPGRRRPTPNPRYLLGGLGERPDLDRRNAAVAQHARQALDVVGMKVGQHDERHAPHVQRAQAAVDQARLGSGVDNDGAARPRVQHQRVTLANIADDEGPSGRGPSGWELVHARHRDECACEARAREAACPA